MSQRPPAEAPAHPTADPVLQVIVEAACSAVTAAHGWIGLEEDGDLRVVAAAGQWASRLLGARQPVGQEPAGFALASGQHLSVARGDHEAELDAGLAGLLPAPPATLLAVPCAWNGQTVGVMELADHQRHSPFPHHHAVLAELFAEVAAAVVMNRSGQGLSSPPRPPSTPTWPAWPRSTTCATPAWHGPWRRCSAVPSPVPAYSRSLAALSESAPTALSEITREWAWQGADGAGVRVAVVDSGVEAGHPALAGCVDEGAGAVVSLDAQGQPVVTPGPHDDLYGHGTACAGIIHAIAPAARISSVRVLGESLGGRSDIFLRGLTWAVESGFDVVNLSLGSGKRDWSLPFYEVCDLAFFRGATLVTAANNLLRPSFPSLYSSVVSVACCEGSQAELDFYVNPEPPVEMLAPGIDIDVAWRGGMRMRATGNSYAAPHVAGLCALILSKHPTLRPAELKAVLYATAVNGHPGGAPGLSVAAAPSVSVRARSAIGSSPRRRRSRDGDADG